MIAAAADVREQLLELAAEEALEAAPGDLELVDGRGAGQGLARPPASTSRTSRPPRTATSCCSAAAPARSPAPLPDCDASGCIGRLGMESFLAPTFFAHAVRCRLDRETGVVRVLEVAAAHDSGRVLNRDRRRRAGRGRRRRWASGWRSRRARSWTTDGRQLNPYLLDYKLQTAADVPPISVDWVEAPSAQRRAERARRAIAEPPCVPTPGAVGNAIAQVAGRVTSCR